MGRGTRMTIDCFCAGILVADHLCTPIAQLPEAGQLVLAESLPLQIGGCAANTAIDLARLHVRTSVLGCVGDDVFGQFVCATLQQHGIATDRIRIVPGVQTSGTLIINVQGQDRRFIHAVGANAHLRAEDIAPPWVAAARVFYVGGYLLMPGLDPCAVRDLFGQARAAGTKTVLDVVLPGPGDHWPALEPVLAETDVFLPNDDEAAALTGLHDPWEQAQRFVDAGARVAVITCGQRGTYLVSRDVRLRAATYDVPFVGGTGAGDAFDAGFIAGLLAGEDLAGCLRWGSALGASCVRGVGATETVFNRDEALAFMQAHRLAIEAH